MAKPKKLTDEQRVQNAKVATQLLRQLPIDVLNTIIPQNKNSQNIASLQPKEVSVTYVPASLLSKAKYIIKNENSGLIHAEISITQMNTAKRITQHFLDTKPKQTSQHQSIPTVTLPPPFVPTPTQKAMPASAPTKLPPPPTPMSEYQSAGKLLAQAAEDSRLKAAGYGFIPSVDASKDVYAEGGKILGQKTAEAKRSAGLHFSQGDPSSAVAHAAKKAGSAPTVTTPNTTTPDVSRTGKNKL